MEPLYALLTEEEGFPRFVGIFTDPEVAKTVAQRMADLERGVMDSDPYDLPWERIDHGAHEHGTVWYAPKPVLDEPTDSWYAIIRAFPDRPILGWWHPEIWKHANLRPSDIPGYVEPDAP